MTLFDWAAHQTQYPARKRDPLTSFQAAEQIGQHVSPLQAAILGCLEEHGPQTTEELSERLGIKLVTISPRMKPMKGKGLVKEAGTKANSSGCRAILWEAVEQWKQR